MKIKKASVFLASIMMLGVFGVSAAAFDGVVSEDPEAQWLGFAAVDESLLEEGKTYALSIDGGVEIVDMPVVESSEISARVEGSAEISAIIGDVEMTDEEASQIYVSGITRTTKGSFQTSIWYEQYDPASGTLFGGNLSYTSMTYTPATDTYVTTYAGWIYC